VAASQHGLVTREQATEHGLTARQITSRLTTGRWIALRPNVYAVAGSPATRQQAILAACLSCRAPASHLTAADLWGLGFPAPTQIDLLTTGRRITQDGIQGHRSRTAADGDCTILHSIPITSPARTLVDVAGTVHPTRLGPLVRDAVRRGVVRLRDLRAAHERVDSGPGRRPTRVLRRVLAETFDDALGDSEPELDVLRLVERAGLPLPKLGHDVLAGGWRYRLDLAWPAHAVAVEFDGWAHHKGYDAFHDDRQRTRRLVAAGWTIVPATAHTPDRELVADLRMLLCGEPTPTDVVGPPQSDQPSRRRGR
jgi:hypothetical protein